MRGWGCHFKDSVGAGADADAAIPAPAPTDWRQFYHAVATGQGVAVLFVGDRSRGVRVWCVVLAGGPIAG